MYSVTKLGSSVALLDLANLHELHVLHEQNILVIKQIYFLTALHYCTCFFMPAHKNCFEICNGWIQNQVSLCREDALLRQFLACPSTSTFAQRLFQPRSLFTLRLICSLRVVQACSLEEACKFQSETCKWLPLSVVNIASSVLC